MPKLRDLVSNFIINKTTLDRIKGEVKNETKKILSQEIKNQIPANISQKIQEEGYKADAIKKLNNESNDKNKAYQFNPFPFSTKNNSPLGNFKPGTGVSFNMLRQFSVQHWASRACIQKRQNQITGLKWDIVPAEEDVDAKGMESQIAEIKEFIKNIGGPNKKYRESLDIIIDDLMTLDGVALFKENSNAGDILWYDNIDAATIKLRVEMDGATPIPPDNAYEQWINGKRIVGLTTDEMIYERMNARANTPYGLSPLESLILTVQSALKSELANLAILTEGNIPEGFLQAPPEWTPDQIKEFQEHFDAIVSGNAKFQSRVRMIPGGSKGGGYIATKKPEDMRNSQFEEWLTIKTCALFGVPPKSIGITFDINKASAEDQSMMARQESIKPLANFIQDLFTRIIQEDLGQEDLAFKFLNLEAKDEMEQANIDKIYLDTGVTNINEVRQRDGKEPLSEEELNNRANPKEPVKETPKKENNPKPKEDTTKKSDSAYQELKRYEKKALNDLRANRDFRKFFSDIIDTTIIASIETELTDCKTSSEIKEVFNKYIGKEQDNFLKAAVNLADSLTEILNEKDGENIKIKGDS